MFLRMEKGDLGEEGLEPGRVFGLLVLDFGVVLQWSLGLIRLLMSLEEALLLVLQRKRGVEGLLLDKKPSFAQLLGLGLGLGICCPPLLTCCESCACLSTKWGSLSLGIVVQKALLHPVPITMFPKFKIQETLMDLKKLTKKEEETREESRGGIEDIEISAQTYSQSLFFSSLNLIFASIRTKKIAASIKCLRSVSSFL